MRILVDIGHPKHVHVFKNVIYDLERKGHDIKIIAKNKDVTFKLLDEYNLKYESIGDYKNNLIGKIFNFPLINMKFFNIVNRFKPDIFISKGSPHSAQISYLLGKPHIAFKDTEHANLTDWLTLPFTKAVCTPNCFKKKIKCRHIKFDGYYELGYLHPKYFKPNYNIIEELDISDKKNFIVLRLVAWNATHDINDKGFTDIKDSIEVLEDYGEILISSEQELGKKFEKYKIKLNPEKMHHLLSFAKMYFGESPTMATESAILGTPSLFLSTSRRCYTDELEEKYELIYSFSDPIHGQGQALNKAVELLNNPNVKKEWAKKRDIMLSEKIDVTSFMVDLITNYPESLHITK